MSVSRYVKVKDHEALIKDVSTGAILNVDKSLVIKHRQKMDQIEKEKLRDSEINNIKGELSEIRQLLQLLVNKD